MPASGMHVSVGALTSLTQAYGSGVYSARYISCVGVMKCSMTRQVGERGMIHARPLRPVVCHLAGKDGALAGKLQAKLLKLRCVELGYVGRCPLRICKSVPSSLAAIVHASA